MPVSEPRRRFLTSAVATGLLAAYPKHSFAIDIPAREPFLHLRKRFSEPVKIAAIDQLQVGNTIWFRVRSEEGETGYCPGNDRLKVTVDMAKQLVIPFFLGKDARDMESLVDRVYTDRDQRGSVYKFAGMPFWNIVGHLEIAVFDLLGKLAGVSVNELIGKKQRTEIPVYISQFGRKTSARQEVENATRDLEKTNAKATKLKIGLRMANSPAQTRRDQEMISLARKTWGDDITIYVDANGSYTAEEAIEMGHFLTDHNVSLLEEPLPWQDYRGTKRVTTALKNRPLQIAGGEQDSSLWQWQDIAEQRIVDWVQPDVFYNGGFIRTLRVAERSGLKVTPHSPKILPTAAANLHLCSVIPNLGPYQEYRNYGKVTQGTVAVPTGPGLGIDLPQAALNRAKVL